MELFLFLYIVIDDTTDSVGNADTVGGLMLKLEREIELMSTLITELENGSILSY